MKTPLPPHTIDILIETRVARLSISIPQELLLCRKFSDQFRLFQKTKDFSSHWKHCLLSKLSLTPPLWNYKKKIKKKKIAAADPSHVILKYEMIIMYIHRITKPPNFLHSSPDPPFNMSHYPD